jgi:carbonic anhydrase
VTPDAKRVLADLLEGNRRFRTGAGTHRTYSAEDLRRIADVQEPKAAVVACSDSRVTPSTIMDQGLGDVFSARVPGNVESDGVDWMVELAVGHFRVPIVIVLGHTGCLAIKTALEGGASLSGSLLHQRIAFTTMGVDRNSPDALTVAAERNAAATAEKLRRLQKVIEAGDRCTVVAAIYEMESGAIRLLDFDSALLDT